MAIKYIAQLETILSSQGGSSSGPSGQPYDSSFFPASVWATAPNYYSWIRQDIENTGPLPGPNQPHNINLNTQQNSSFTSTSPKYFGNSNKLKETPANESYWHHDGTQPSQFVYQ
uniref:Putative salivary gland-expressed bhlh n=2 Tax=Ornithodoros turicata TaxID=34597 RepID=A0A2R5L9U8_9ACAR